MSIEERLEKLEKSKSRDAQRQERAEALEKLKKTPIKYVDDDPSRIHKSKAEVIADKAKNAEDANAVKKFLAERNKEKKDAVQKEKVEEKVEVKKRGRPKRVE